MIVLENRNAVACTCTRCGSSIGVHEGDITYDDANPRMPEFSARCGTCGAVVAVPSASIPSSWMQRLAPQGS